LRVATRGETSPLLRELQEYTLIVVFDAYIGCSSDKLSAPEWKSGAWMGYDTVSALATWAVGTGDCSVSGADTRDAIASGASYRHWRHYVFDMPGTEAFTSEKLTSTSIIRRIGAVPSWVILPGARLWT